MSRFSMRSLILPAPAAFTRLFAIAGLVLVAAPCAASDVVIVDVAPLVRKFPEGFCPLPISVPFTPSGTQVTIHFAADVYVPNSFGPEPTYTDQAIDNIAVVPSAVHAAHSRANTGRYEGCYLDDSDPEVDNAVPSIFMFDEGIGPVPLLDLFTSGAPGWDVSQDCFYDPGLSAHNNPSGSTPNSTGGSLRLGTVKGTPTVPDIARTSFTLTGLTGGQGYVLSGWWHAIGGIFFNQVKLKIQISEPESTPVNGGTWGSLKIRYR